MWRLLGAAGNNMLTGEEGEAACRALAKAVAACSSLQQLDLSSEWREGGGRGMRMMDGRVCMCERACVAPLPLPLIASLVYRLQLNARLSMSLYACVSTYVFRFTYTL